MPCDRHRTFKLELMPVLQPQCASLWSASTALELVRGASVAEAVNMTTAAKGDFYLGVSSAVVELRLAEPSDDQLVLAMHRIVAECPERNQVRTAFCASVFNRSFVGFCRDRSYAAQVHRYSVHKKKLLAKCSWRNVFAQPSMACPCRPTRLLSSVASALVALPSPSV
jgi:hypothetical protein